jgi:hypothetical protein
MPRITISYRRDDSPDITGHILDRLADHFGRQAVFRDIDSIPPGADFRRHIDRVVDESDIILAIVGPRWIGPDDELLRPGSPVRLEIETALRKDKPLIPVLVSRAVMPHPDMLPDSLHDFACRNAVQVDSGQDFDVHVGRLIRAIERLLRIDGERTADEAVQGVIAAIEAAPSLDPTPKGKPLVDSVVPPVSWPAIREKKEHAVRWVIGLGLAVILGIIGASGWWVLLEHRAEMTRTEEAATEKARAEDRARQAAAVAKAEQEEQAHQVAAANAQVGDALKRGKAALDSKDYVEAMRWYRKAADQGDADAQYNIGWLYEHGRGVAQDYAEAMRWYRKAADQGNANAKAGLMDLEEHTGQHPPQGEKALEERIPDEVSGYKPPLRGSPGGRVGGSSR